MKKKNDEKWVIIGSTGLSTNVQNNFNQENMVLIKLPHIYDYFKEHFNKISESPKIKEIKNL